MSKLMNSRWRVIGVTFVVAALLFVGLWHGHRHASAVSGPDANDDFSNATVISGPLPFADSSTKFAASIEIGEPQPCATVERSVWYAYTPSANVTLTAYTAGSSMDTSLAAYVGASLGTLTNIACDDNGGPGTTSEIVINAIAGTTYYIQVGGLNDYVGGLQFSLHEPPVKGNDDQASAIVVGGPIPYSNKEDAGGATLEPLEPQPCADIDNTVWYSYTPPADVLLAADTEGSTYDTALAVYAGSVDMANVVGCDDNAGTAEFSPTYPYLAIYGRSRLAFQALAGKTYFFQVGGAFEARGHLAFNLSEEVSPAKGNDDFANAVEIASLPYSNTQNTEGALIEPGEIVPCSYPPSSSLPTELSFGGSVWYSYTPGVDMTLTAATSGDFAAMHRIYRGSSLASLTPMGCGKTTLIANAGVTYYFQLFGCAEIDCDGSAGDASFELSGTPCPLEGCVEMRLTVPGGDCNEATIPAVCDIPVGSSFQVGVDIVRAPPGGYLLAQSYVYFGSDLTYKPTAEVGDEILWPDCDPDVAQRAQVDLTLPFPRHSDEVLLLGCITSLLPPLPTSTYVGPFVEFTLNCSADKSTTEAKLLRYGQPKASGNGTIFVSHVSEGIIQTVPKVNHLIINCVEPSAVGGVALDGGLAATPDGGARGGVPWWWILGGAGLTLLGADAWRRHSTGNRG